MGAVTIKQRLDPVRTGAAWEQDILFALADKVTPQAIWAGCTAEVIMTPKSAVLAVAHSFRLDAGDVSVGDSDALVRIRVPMETTPDYLPADYFIEINRIDTDGVRHPAAIGPIPVQQGQALIVDDQVLLNSPDGAGGAGTIIVTPTGSTYATGTGPAGLGLREWKTITEAYIAAPGDRLICDSRAGGFPVTLPALGGDVWLEDLEGSFGLHAVTLIGNGRTINGAASDTAEDGGFRFHFTSGEAAWAYTFDFIFGSI